MTARTVGRFLLGCLLFGAVVVAMAFLVLPVIAIFTHVPPRELIDQLSNPVVHDALIVGPWHPGRLQYHRSRQVAQPGRHGDVCRPDPKAPRVPVEERAEDARRVGPRHAHPFDVAARRHECHRFRVRQERVVPTRREGARARRLR